MISHTFRQWHAGIGLVSDARNEWIVAVVHLILEAHLGACHVARVNELVHSHLLPH